MDRIRGPPPTPPGSPERTKSAVVPRLSGRQRKVNRQPGFMGRVSGTCGRESTATCKEASKEAALSRRSSTARSNTRVKAESSRGSEKVCDSTTELGVNTSK